MKQRLSKLIVLLVLVSGIGFSAGKNQNSPGPQGPAGADGVNGKDGNDSSVPKWQAGIGAGVRVWDSKHTSGNFLYLHDFVRPQNAVYGIVGLKLGKSSEDREIDKLRADLAALKASQKASPTPEPKQKVTIRGN
jgi:hypothetical protein